MRLQKQPQTGQAKMLQQDFQAEKQLVIDYYSELDQAEAQIFQMCRKDIPAPITFGGVITPSTS